MKKAVTTLLLLAMVIGLFGCSTTDNPETTAASAAESTGAAESAAFMVGYAREDITPRTAVSLGGYGMSERRLTDPCI